MGSGFSQSGGECPRLRPERLDRYSTRYSLMATRTRAKAEVRTGAGKGKGGRRPPVRVKSGPEIPLLPVAVGGILLALLIGMIVYIVVNNRPAPTPAVVAGIPCDRLEHTQVHYHAALRIMYQGALTPIPGGIGIQGGEQTPSCYYWLHVHSTSPDVIHVESPASQTFTLGQFFDVWNTWSKSNGEPAQRLDATHVATFTLTPSQKLAIYIDLGDGKGAQLYTGDPRAIVLKNHEVITVEIAPPDGNPPPAFTFPSGL